MSPIKDLNKSERYSVFYFLKSVVTFEAVKDRVETDIDLLLLLLDEFELSRTYLNLSFNTPSLSE